MESDFGGNLIMDWSDIIRVIICLLGNNTVRKEEKYRRKGILLLPRKEFGREREIWLGNEDIIYGGADAILAPWYCQWVR